MDPRARATEPPPRWSNAFIAVVLALQVLVPLRYYVGSDPYDERFSWRMFSTVRVARCSSETLETSATGERTVNLSNSIHEAWIANLRRNRDRVARAVLRRRCDAEGVSSVRIHNRCTGPDGEAMPDMEWRRECATGEVRAP
ncbi:MAG: hypothetical protein R3A78_08735 [Polyangiales bacterium]|nr:hypothetical protein [Myxococcales bacterium]